MNLSVIPSSCFIVLLLISLASCVRSSDITNLVFDKSTEGYVPAAFGDFNSDELTDIFMIYDDERAVRIFLAQDIEPLLVEGPTCKYPNERIVSVVPGDFNGDAFMDVMLVTQPRNNRKSNLFDIYLNWGSSDRLNCTSTPVIRNLNGEPMTLDYNQDMIIDLFGLNENNERVFYIFNNRSEPPKVQPMNLTTTTDVKFSELKIPHSNAYLDLNNDFAADLFLVTKDKFEVWNGQQSSDFVFSRTYAIDENIRRYGQSIFLDFELKGHLMQILPACSDDRCTNSTIIVRSGEQFFDLDVNFKDPDNVQWGFGLPNDDELYSNTITLRGGDFNMDGYPDLIVTLTKKTSGSKNQYQTFLLENVKDTRNGAAFNRTFMVCWKALLPFSNGTVMGAFYDFYQDGVLDVILVERIPGEKKYKTVAFRNTLDYDANFIKVIVLTGLRNEQNPPKSTTPLGRHKKTYGTNLPGPRIEYATTTQEGTPQHGATAQLPQSAYSALHLPYTIFGLGRTPNFVDTLTVGLSHYKNEWTQIIPNSQMIVIPWPIKEPTKWKAQLFVTPSKLILMSVFALGGTCLVIMFIILGLYIKEKREDKIEKLAEAHRFHFDAM